MLVGTDKVSVNTLQRNLGNIGAHLPHIVDVEWKLDLVANTSALENENKLQYTVKLKTECGENEDVNFVCNVTQLQDLIYKLKEIIRHCENVGS